MSRPEMVWPWPSLKASRLIDTPVAAPVTTTWKASNSFLAAAICAAAWAPAGACICGRTFTLACVVQTWAAEAALEARTAAAANSRESFFKGVSLVDGFPERRGFLVPVAQRRGRAA